MQHRRFSNLLTDGNSRVERRRSTLCEVGHFDAAQVADFIIFHVDDVFTVQAYLTPGELEARLGVTQG